MHEPWKDQRWQLLQCTIPRDADLAWLHPTLAAGTISKTTERFNPNFIIRGHTGAGNFWEEYFLTGYDVENYMLVEYWTNGFNVTIDHLMYGVLYTDNTVDPTLEIGPQPSNNSRRSCWQRVVHQYHGEPRHLQWE